MDVLAHLQPVQMDVQFWLSSFPCYTAVQISTDILVFTFIVLVN